MAFRWATQGVARQLKVVGWVRNLWDGRVEVLAEGEEAILVEFIKFLRQGPKYAKVKNVEIDWLDPTGEFEDFKVRY